MNFEAYNNIKKKELSDLAEKERNLKIAYNDAVLIGDTEEMDRVYTKLESLIPHIALLRTVINDESAYEYILLYSVGSNSSHSSFRSEEEVATFLKNNQNISRGLIYRLVGVFKPTVQIFDHAIIKDDSKRKEGNPHNVFHEVYEKERKNKIQL